MTNNSFQNLKQVAKPVLSLLVICLFMSAAVSVAYFFTKEPIAALEREATRASISELLPETAEYTASADGEYTIYTCFDAGGGPCGVVYVTDTAGYGGAIRLMVGIKDAGVVSGIRILSSSETPGLGKKAENEAFYGQFSDGPLSGYALKKGQAGEAGGIDAITAATITSQAVVDGVNGVLSHYRTNG